jgi:hypothetical protein
LVIGHWSLVIGHWSLVIGHWSLVIGHWSLVIGHLTTMTRSNQSFATRHWSMQLLCATAEAKAARGRTFGLLSISTPYCSFKYLVGFDVFALYICHETLIIVIKIKLKNDNNSGVNDV